MSPARSVEEVLELRAARSCLVCNATAQTVGEVPSRIGPTRSYRLARCGLCGFGFIEDPRTDFEHLYDADYYAGRGVDPLVAYESDLEPGSVREHEWRGIVEIVADLHPVRPGAWLDYGCGCGGLVRHVGSAGAATRAVGFDHGHSLDRVRSLGLEAFDEQDLASHPAEFDVVTAIEVLEHTLDPMAALGEITGALADGGVLFVTTGNAAKHARHLDRWAYVIPEIHISFFEPRTLETAYRTVGLVPIPNGRSAGMTDIIRYKVLKTLKRTKVAPWERFVPWSLVSVLADRREGVSAQPAARKDPEDR